VCNVGTSAVGPLFLMSLPYWQLSAGPSDHCAETLRYAEESRVTWASCPKDSLRYNEESGYATETPELPAQCNWAVGLSKGSVWTV
jgi:hypothetical protein